MTNILSTGLRMAGKTLRRSAVSIAMLLLLVGRSAYACDLTILHINDHHLHLKRDGRMSLKSDGKSIRVRSGALPTVFAKIRELQEVNQNVIKLHAGDAISGSLFFTLFKAETDAALINEVCFDAFELGIYPSNLATMSSTRVMPAWQNFSIS